MRPTFFCCFSHAGSSNPSRSHSSSSSIYPSYSCSDIFLFYEVWKASRNGKIVAIQLVNSPCLYFYMGLLFHPARGRNHVITSGGLFGLLRVNYRNFSYVWISRGEADLIYNVIADKASLQSTDSDYICIIISLHFYYEFLI